MHPGLFAFLLLFTASGPALLAQTVTSIRGSVTDEIGEPVPGANVFIEGSYDGTSSGEGGVFSFHTSEVGERTLVVSFIGYEEFRIGLELAGQDIKVDASLRPKALELKSIVIGAGMYEASDENRREVLKPLDIVSTAGATADLIGVFNTLPGTQVVGEEGRLYVRGGEGRESRTFIDGMQVGNFYSPAVPNTPSRSRFLPFMFSGASFSTGGYSAEYGQALSSALILQSKPVAQQDRVDISLMSVGADASFTRAWASSSLSGKLQYTNLDPYFGMIEQDLEWVNPPTSYEGNIAYRKELGHTGILKVYGNGNHSNLTFRRAEIDRPDERIQTDIENDYLYLNSVYHDKISGGWNLKAGTSFTGNRDRIGLDRRGIDQLSLAFHGKLSLQRSLNDIVGLKMGSEYFLTKYRSEYSNPGIGPDVSHDYISQLPVLFAESDLRISEKIMSRVGLRAEYASLQDRILIFPRLSVAWKAGSRSEVSAAYGHFGQEAEPGVLLEDPGIRHEKARHYILHYQYSHDGRTFRAEAYYKDYDDLVLYSDDPKGAPLSYSNGGSGYAKGIDLFWRDNKSIKGAEYWLSYSYLDTRRRYRDYPQPATPSYASRHNLSLVYKHFLPDIRTQVGATFRYASGRPFHDPNLEGFPNRRTGDYLDLSLNASYLITQQIILHASATNVLGRDHIFGYEFASMPGESGVYASRPVRSPADRFLFVGLFLTFSKEDTFNQLPNL